MKASAEAWLRHENITGKQAILRPRHPARAFAFFFLAFIAFGTLLLKLPWSSAGEPVSWSTAFFTSTSSVCVAGMAVRDTATTFSPFGQAVLLLLCQIGGLGYMFSSTFLFILFGREVGLHDRLLLRDTLGQVSLRDTRRLVFRTMKFVGLMELIGAILLTIRFWIDGRYSFISSVWHGIFHSVMAFCNGGFDIKGVGPEGQTSLALYRHDPAVNLIIASLIIIGGLGFVTSSEVYEVYWRQRHKKHRALSLSTRLILILSGILLVTGTFFFLVAEWTNPKTLGTLPIGEKFLAAFFQSATVRTAGFATLDFGQMRSITLLMSGLLMFIGTGPGGTGGGVKITTFAAMIAAVAASLRGKTDVEILNRRISSADVFRALVLVMLSATAIVAGTFALAFSEPEHLREAGFRDNLFMRVQFEAISAFTTAGVSTGITPALSEVGRVIVAVLMFLGRLGPTTVAAALAIPSQNPKRRLPEEGLNLG